MRRIRNWLWLVPLLPLLNGCHWLRSTGSCHKTQPYMNAKSTAPLKVPPGLDTPDTSNALRLPALNEPPAPPRTGRDPCLDYPPPFKVVKPATPQA